MCNLGKNTDFDFMSPICRLYGQVELRSTHLSLEILDFIESVLVAAEKFDHSEASLPEFICNSALHSDVLATAVRFADSEDKDTATPRGLMSFVSSSATSWHRRSWLVKRFEYIILFLASCKRESKRRLCRRFGLRGDCPDATCNHVSNWLRQLSKIFDSPGSRSTVVAHN